MGRERSNFVNKINMLERQLAECKPLLKFIVFFTYIFFIYKIIIMNNNECLDLIKSIYNNIFKVDSEFEMIFMSYMLYVNFKYEEIFSDPVILELIAKNSSLIDRQLKLNKNLTRRQLESMYLTLNLFLYLSLNIENTNQVNKVNGEVNGEVNNVDDVD